MSTERKLSNIRRRLARQTGQRCGYCLSSERLTGIPLTLDHILPLVAGGSAEEDNLWIACRPCNEFKGAQTQTKDPDTGRLAPLFNPRLQSWHEHFRWSPDGTLVLGLTPTGRATVAALQMNRELIVHARRQWVKVGWHPPEEPEVQF